MKRLLFFAFCALCVAQTAFAQQIPQGMKYQAVARDNSGEVMIDKQIELKVSLHGDIANAETFYSEEHSVTTNKLGLFTLTIGDGYVESGVFYDIPWSTRDVWMRVAIRQNGDSEFSLISESRMLSVPYAFHAATAARLVETQDGIGPDDGDGQTPDPGSTSNNWHTDGNLGTDPIVDKLGTADSTELIIITNYEERINVTADGDVLIANNARVGKKLEVRDTVWLNTGKVEGGKGVTIVYGDFTVDSLSPTLLSGTLDVDGKTDLNGKLNVYGESDFYNLLNVNMGKPTHMTGTLLVDGIASFSNTTNSSDQSNGAVIVAGGMGVDSNLNVGGNFDVRGSAAFGGPVGFESVVTISDTSQSNTTGDGALIVYGGIGLGKNINVGEDLNVGKNTHLGGTLNVVAATTLNDILTVSGATQLNQTLDVLGATDLGSTLDVTGLTTPKNNLKVHLNSNLVGALTVGGLTTLTNVTNSNIPGDGALIVTGGVGIGKNLNVGGSTKLSGVFTVETAGTIATVDSKTGNHVALFKNTTPGVGGSGIAIQVGASTPHHNNNFITFLRADGQEVGRIEGEDGATDLARNREYQDDLAFKKTAIALSVTAEVIEIVQEIQAIVEVVAASTSITVCVGFGICVTAPIPSWIVSSVANLVVQTANLILQTADLAVVIADLVVFENTHEALFGITFASGAEDYAEYLPKYDVNEIFLRGDVVGMRHGFITKNTHNADKIMVISHNPAMLGGLPSEDDKGAYEMVAFMGQIPTRIMGAAEPGDYILASGYHNGFGIAKNPEDMTPEDYAKVLGVAWERAEGIEMNIVNVAVGLNSNDLADLVARQAEKIEKQNEQLESLQQQMRETNTILAELVPGFKEAAGVEGEFSSTRSPKSLQKEEAIELTNNDAYNQHPHDRTAANDVIYYEVTDEELEAGFAMAQEMYTKYGVDISDHPFWNRISTESGYKEEVMQNMRVKLKHAMHMHQEINHGLERD